MFCKITGDNYKTHTRCLSDPFRIRFKRGAEDSFYLTTPKKLGKIEEITIWHNDNGPRPSWFLCKVSVHDLIQGRSYHFLCNSWLAIECEDGQLERTLTPSSRGELRSFRNVFYDNLKYYFTEYHLWLSVIFRPVKSNFTRTQRLSCCLTVIYSVILTSVLICRFTDLMDIENDSLFSLLPILLSHHVVIFGISVNMVIVPCHMLLMLMFRSINKKPKLLIEALKKESDLRQTSQDNQRHLRPSIFQTEEEFGDIIKWLNESQQFDDHAECHNVNTKDSGQVNLGFAESVMTFGTEEEMNKQFAHDDEQKSRIEKSSNQYKQDTSYKYITSQSSVLEKYISKADIIQANSKLPYKFVGFAWLVMLILILSSAFVAIVLSMQLSHTTSQTVLASVTLALIGNFLILEPMKVIALSIINTLKPTFENTHKDDIKINVTDNDNLASKNASRSFIPQITSISFTRSRKKKELRRQQRLKEIRLNTILKELLFYSLFLGCLAVVGFKQRDALAYQLVEEIKTIFDGRYSNITGRQVNYIP